MDNRKPLKAVIRIARLAGDNIIVPTGFGVKSIARPVFVDVQAVDPDRIIIVVQVSSKIFIKACIGIVIAHIHAPEFPKIVLIADNIQIQLGGKSGRKSLIVLHPEPVAVQIGAQGIIIVITPGPRTIIHLPVF